MARAKPGPLSIVVLIHPKRRITGGEAGGNPLETSLAYRMENLPFCTLFSLLKVTSRLNIAAMTSFTLSAL
jgi:hypothetical protein